MSDRDDDWFEQALRDAADEADSGDVTPAERDADTPNGDDDQGPDPPDPMQEEGGRDPLAADDPEDAPSANDDVTSTNDDVTSTNDDVTSTNDDVTSTNDDDPSTAGPHGAVDDGGGAIDTDTDTETDSDPFGEDFASALQNAPGPDTGFGADAGASTDGEFGGGPGGDFGLGRPSGPGGPGGESFDEEAFDSDIERLEVGIEGLDEMILGGIPTRSLMVTIGSAGTGKTTFGMQFLHRALEAGDNAVFISLEEGRERILETADEKGWEFSGYEEAGSLAIVDFDPVEMAHSLASIQNELPRLIEEFDADRLVLDSVSLLEMMYDHPAKRRSEVFQFTRALKEAGVTTFVTSEASEESPYSSRHGIIEYLADVVFVLQYVRPSDFQETRLAVEIQKIRDANHSRETKPYEITGEGISVYRQANIF